MGSMKLGWWMSEDGALLSVSRSAPFWNKRWCFSHGECHVSLVKVHAVSKLVWWTRVFNIMNLELMQNLYNEALNDKCTQLGSPVWLTQISLKFHNYLYTRFYTDCNCKTGPRLLEKIKITINNWLLVRQIRKHTHTTPHFG